MRAFVRVLATLVVILNLKSDTRGEWGNFKGRFVYDGPVPETKFISTNGKDQPTCGEKVLDESLLVDKKTGGVANVVVFLRTKDVKVHPDYEATAKNDVSVVMENCRYNPHIVLLRLGQDMVWTNRDKVTHGPIYQPPAEAGNSTIFVPGQSQPSSRHQIPQNLPIPMACVIHVWMRAYVVCRDNPYMAVTKQDGSFEIKQISGGEHEFQFWHEKTAFLVAKSGWLKGRAKFTIKAGETTDLGDIKLDPKLFTEDKK